MLKIYGRQLEKRRKKNRQILEILCLIGLFCFAMFFIYQSAKEYRLQQGIAQKVLRFHVRANSDSAKDQELKLKVRDAVGAYMQKKLEHVTDLESCKQAAQKELPEIVRIAELTLRENGCQDTVTAKLEEAPFPQKSYGAYIFPGGTYQALNVVIGSGKGHNWWCVLYPNMCFHGAVYEVVDKDSQEELRRVLSPEEYETVLRSGNYRIKFKLFK